MKGLRTGRVEACRREDLPLGGGEKVDPQIAVLETNIAHLQTDVSEIKENQRRLVDKVDALTGDMNRRFEVVNKDISGVRTATESTKVWMLITMFGTLTGMLTLIAHAFKWI